MYSYLRFMTNQQIRNKNCEKKILDSIERQKKMKQQKQVINLNIFLGGFIVRRTVCSCIHVHVCIYMFMCMYTC